MLYKIIAIISMIIIVLFLIGLRGVQVDTFLSEELRSKFLIKYSIILVVSTCLFVFSILMLKRKKKL